MIRHALPVACLILLAGCAGVEPQTPAAEPIAEETGSSEPDRRIGRIAIELEVAPSAERVPADVEIAFTLRPTNAIGDPLDGAISWDLAITGADKVVSSGTSEEHTETFRLEERGAYLVVLRAGGDIFRNATATATFALDPIPLEADLEAPDHATRGNWSTLSVDVAHGYSDLGHDCHWGVPAGALVAEPDACSTQVRWYEAGNRTVNVTVSDGLEDLTLQHQVAVAPLPAYDVPTEVPTDPLISDDTTEETPDHVDIIGAWFGSDLDHLFVGLAVADLSNAPTVGATYSVTFTPSWNTSMDGGHAERFRVLSEEPPGDAPDIIRTWRLQADVAGSWIDVAAVDDAVLDDGAGLLWWPVLRSDMGAPLLNATISAPVASAGIDGTDIGETASSDAEYALD